MPPTGWSKPRAGSRRSCSGGYRTRRRPRPSRLFAYCSDSLARRLRLRRRLKMQRSVIVQHRRELMELAVAKSFGLNRPHGGDDVFAVCAGLAMALLHVTELIR